MIKVGGSERRGEGTGAILSPIRQFSSKQSDFDIIEDLFLVFDHVSENCFFDARTKSVNA